MSNRASRGKVLFALLLTICGLQALAADNPLLSVALRIEEADSLQRIGQNEAALKVVLEAIATADAGNVSDSVAVAAQKTAARIYWSLADYPNAERLWRIALGRYEKSPDMMLPGFAQTHSDLASALFAQGKYEEAAAHYESALAMFRACLGEKHHTVAVVLSNLGALYSDMGRMSRAEPYVREAIELKRAELGDLHPAVAASVRDLGNLYLEQGRFKDAEESLLQALEIQNKTFLPTYPNSPEIGKTISLLAQVYAAQGRLVEAEYCFTQAASIYAQSLGEEHPEYAQVVIWLAAFLAEGGRYHEADSLITFGASILDHNTSSQSVALSCRVTQAVIKWMAGDQEAAELLFEQARQEIESALPDDHPLSLYFLSEYALFLNAQGRSSAACEHMKRAFDLRFRNFENEVAVLPERIALQYAAQLRHTVGDYLSLLLARSETGQTQSTEIAAVMAQSKGAVTRVIAQRLRSPSASEDEQIAVLRDSLATARQNLARLRYQKRIIIDGAYGRELATAVAEKERLELLMAERQAPADHSARPAESDSGDISAAIPEKSAVVDYLVYGHHISADSTQPRMLACVWRKHREPVIVELGEAEQINRAMQWYREHFAQIESQNLADYDLLSGELYDLVWKPLLPFLGESEIVFVSPDGALNGLSFAGLKSSSGEFLIERYAIHYLASLSDIAQSNGGDLQSNGLLSISNPDFDLAPFSLASDSSVTSQIARDTEPEADRSGGVNCIADLHEVRWCSLPGTAKEAATVCHNWQATSEPTVQLQGREATEANFTREASTYRVIHIATHGYSISGSRTQMARESLTETRIGEENPLLQCGLVFAGANLQAGRRVYSGEDGFLSAEEIVGLDLSKTELVILAACETALGETLPGEGVFGLTRAFLLAGAKSVASSFWRVPDTMTADLVPLLLAGELPPNPRQIQDALLQKIQSLRAAASSDHPYFWAGFGTYGDWR